VRRGCRRPGQLYATGKRDPGGFPALHAADGDALYSWAAVADWFTAHTKLITPMSEHARILAAARLLRVRTLMPDLHGVAPLTG
jgi:hypothetical protein